LLRLTTDGQKASRGLSATAELLVYFAAKLSPRVFVAKRHAISSTCLYSSGEHTNILEHERTMAAYYPCIL